MPVRKATFGLCVALISSILYLVLHYVTNSINNVVKQPYMDEVFHIPQAQRYCQGNFTFYDPKITTPPGLYLLSYLRLWLRDKILLRRTELICDTIDLRRTNHLITISNFVVLVLIRLSNCNRINLGRRYGFKQRIAYTMDQSTTLDLANILLTSISIILLPPLFFFNPLYYTDAGSLLFTLLAYLFSVNDQHSIASLFGILSVLFRQTNIVWLFYTACLVILRTLDEYRHISSRNANSQTSPNNILVNKRLLLNLFKRCAPYAIVGALFVIFVFINKGIVLGDKEAHQMKFHFAQILYFLGFCSIFGASWIFQLRVLRRFLYFIIRNPIAAALAVGLIIYLISFGRYAHPYLLADNRHLTFYIWRRILDRHNSYAPHLLTPFYLLSSLGIWHHFRINGCKQMILYIFCTMLVTVPNGLLEPRYFIIPFVFLRLSTESSLLGLLFEIGQHLAINISMHYLFLHKTFQWADSPEVQRIMW